MQFVECEKNMCFEPFLVMECAHRGSALCVVEIFAQVIYILRCSEGEICCALGVFCVDVFPGIMPPLGENKQPELAPKAVSHVPPELLSFYREGWVGVQGGATHGKSTSGSRGPAPCPHDFFSKSNSFQAILREKPLFWAIFLASGSPLGSKLRWAP